MSEREGRAQRALLEIDYLLMVDNAVRPGALRFKEAGSQFLASRSPKIPPLVYLSKLLAASDRVVADKESDEEPAAVTGPGFLVGWRPAESGCNGCQGPPAHRQVPACRG